MMRCLVENCGSSVQVFARGLFLTVALNQAPASSLIGGQIAGDQSRRLGYRVE